MFLGQDLLPLLVLALGGALMAGNALALIRSPRAAEATPRPRPPVARSVTMILIGLVTTVWALATLTT